MIFISPVKPLFQKIK